MAGTYHLRSIGGDSLPVVLRRDPASGWTYEATAGIVRLNDDRTCVDSVATREDRGGLIVVGPQKEWASCTFAVDGRTILLVYISQDTVRGSLERDRLELRRLRGFDGVGRPIHWPWVYRRSQGGET